MRCFTFFGPESSNAMCIIYLQHIFMHMLNVHQNILDLCLDFIKFTVEIVDSHIHVL